jgi:hypothetical protein
VSLQEIQNISAPDGAAAGTVPVATGAEAATTQSQSIVANSTQPAKIAGEITHYGFVTFDPGRKHLARIVAVKREKVSKCWHVQSPKSIAVRRDGRFCHFVS